MILNPSRRRAGSVLSAAASVVCAVMFLSAAVAFLGRSDEAGAAATAGTAVVSDGAGAPLASGGSDTEFFLQLPNGAACTGDTAVGGYKVQTYIVPSSVDPGTLTFGGSGPLPKGTGANLRQALFDATLTSSVANLPTDVATSNNGPGIISNLPGFNFSPFSPNVATVYPAGTYNLGIACTLGVAGPTQLDRYWNARITFSASDVDPGGATWVAEAAPEPTTTSSTTTSTTEATTTTTTEGGSTTTTTSSVDGSTTTTVSGDVGGGGFSGGAPSAASPVTTAGQLPYTGSSPIPMVVWAVALIVFGRMAMLLGKRPKIIDDPTG